LILAYKSKIKELENELKSKDIEINLLKVARNTENSNNLMQINDLRIENKIMLEELEKARNTYEEALKEKRNNNNNQ
jgi:hypothetical protein